MLHTNYDLNATFEVLWSKRMSPYRLVLLRHDLEEQPLAQIPHTGELRMDHYTRGGKVLRCSRGRHALTTQASVFRATLLLR